MKGQGRNVTNEAEISFAVQRLMDAQHVGALSAINGQMRMV